ncbi:MAG: hypothetical protein O3C63_08585 [Cyanobacteria bacterium]|nr:hypothetical protein [Cyanobacteriota bacterium]MDA1021137.1 hypothetical protein [Cyanobacteriota bacterium]
MKYVDFKSKMANMIVFNKADIHIIAPNFDLNLLSDWQKKQYIRKIRRGYYIFADLELNNHLLSHIANQIYRPSYISFELALSQYGLIPETIVNQTSATSRRTIDFYTPIGGFIYQHLKPSLIFGYRIDTLAKVKVKIAKIEKAVLDYFYLHPDLKTKQDLDDLRFDYEYFIEQADLKLLYRYLDQFNNKALEKRIDNIIRSAHHA